MPSSEKFHSSLRRCDLYDNPYNARMQVNPSIVKRRQEICASHDSISSAQRKLEKEIFESFKQHSVQIFSGKLFIIAQAGKYAFLAIMLPTYLFFYGIPKWLLTEAVPNIYHFTKRIVTRSGSKIGGGVSHVTSAAFAIVKTVTDPILNFIQTQIEKSREFYHNVKQRLEQAAKALMRATSYPFQMLHKNFVQPIASFIHKFIHPIQTLRQTIGKIIENVKGHKERFREALISFPKKVEEVFHRASDKIKMLFSKIPKSLAPIVDAFNRADEKLGQLFEKARDFKNRIMDRVVYKPAATLREVYHLAKERSLALFHHVYDPTATWLNPKIERVVKFSRKVKERAHKIGEAMSSKLRTVSDKVSEIVKKLTEDPSAIKHELMQILPQPVIAFFSPFVLAAGWVIKTPYRLFRERKNIHSRTYRIKEKIKNSLVRMNQQLLTFFKKNFAKLKPKIKALVKGVKNVMIKTFRVLKEMLKGAFYMLRMIFAWLKILIKQGMLLVIETCSSWLPDLSTNHRDLR